MITSAKLINIANFAREMMNEYGLTEWTFQFDTASVRYGQCNYTWKRISLSAKLVELNTEAQTLDTILHEIAHALAGPRAKHGWEWVRIAKSIGCNGERCYNSAEVVLPKLKYTATCPAGHTTQYARRPRNRRSCGICDPRWNPDYIMTFTENV